MGNCTSHKSSCSPSVVLHGKRNRKSNLKGSSKLHDSPPLHKRKPASASSSPGDDTSLLSLTSYQSPLVRTPGPLSVTVTVTEDEILCGTFVDGALHGQGYAHSLVGGAYRGNWSNGLMHGFGRYCFQQAACTYDGEFSEGRRTGAGVLYAKDFVYCGFWLDDCFDGPGALMHTSGGALFATWRCGQMDPSLPSAVLSAIDVEGLLRAEHADSNDPQELSDQLPSLRVSSTLAAANPLSPQLSHTELGAASRKKLFRGGPLDSPPSPSDCYRNGLSGAPRLLFQSSTAGDSQCGGNTPVHSKRLHRLSEMEMDTVPRYSHDCADEYVTDDGAICMTASKSALYDATSTALVILHKIPGSFATLRKFARAPGAPSIDVPLEVMQHSRA